MAKTNRSHLCCFGAGRFHLSQRRGGSFPAIPMDEWMGLWTFQRSLQLVIFRWYVYVCYFKPWMVALKSTRLQGQQRQIQTQWFEALRAPWLHRRPRPDMDRDFSIRTYLAISECNWALLHIKFFQSKRRILPNGVDMCGSRDAVSRFIERNLSVTSHWALMLSLPFA